MIGLVIVFLIYLFLVLGLALEGHTYQPRGSFFKKEKTFNHDLNFTVIATFRNEEKNLPLFLGSLGNQDYPKEKIQILLVNDHSTDLSLDLVTEWNRDHTGWDVRVLQRETSSVSAKKDGITQALASARYEYIICTDVDIILPTSWISSYNQFYRSYGNSHFIAGPVKIFHAGHFWGRIQQLEMLALQIITIGSFKIRKAFMCNGANMSFTKTAFAMVEGYAGNTHITSGDDVFLLEKMLELDVERVHYLKDQKACVTTYPKQTFMKMVWQRVRWAAKGNHTKSLLNKTLGIQVVLTNLSLIALPVLVACHILAIDVAVILFALKFLTDVLAVFLASRFFKVSPPLYQTIIYSLIYPLIIFSITTLLFTSNAKWKQRALNQAHGRA